MHLVRWALAGCQECAFAGMGRYLTKREFREQFLCLFLSFATVYKQNGVVTPVCLLDVAEGHRFVHKSTLGPEVLISQRLILAQSTIAVH